MQIINFFYRLCPRSIKRAEFIIYNAIDFRLMKKKNLLIISNEKIYIYLYFTVRVVQKRGGVIPSKVMVSVTGIKQTEDGQPIIWGSIRKVYASRNTVKQMAFIHWMNIFCASIVYC